MFSSTAPLCGSFHSVYSAHSTNFLPWSELYLKITPNKNVPLTQVIKLYQLQKGNKEYSLISDGCHLHVFLLPKLAVNLSPASSRANPIVLRSGKCCLTRREKPHSVPEDASFRLHRLRRYFSPRMEVVST